MTTIERFERRIQALRALLAENPNEHDRAHYITLLEQTQQRIDMLRQESNESAPTTTSTVARLNQLEEVCAYWQQHLDDPKTVPGVVPLLTKHMQELRAHQIELLKDLRKLDPNLQWKPPSLDIQHAVLEGELSCLGTSLEIMKDLLRNIPKGSSAHTELQEAILAQEQEHQRIENTLSEREP